MAGRRRGPERAWSLVANEVIRRTGRRLRAGVRYRWRFVGRTPERIIVAPPDLRHVDIQIAREIYSGRFPLAGHLVKTGGQSPFEIRVAEKSWRKSLHSFRWLRHMEASGSDLAATNARTLVSDWINGFSSKVSGVAWEPGTTAKRIIAWLQHSTIVLQGADIRFHRSFLRSLAEQVRYLRWAVHGLPDDKDRLRIQVALAFAALALPSNAATLRNATKALGDELDRQILPDGGHASRNPLTILELLADLVPLSQTYTIQAGSPPAALRSAIDRMMPALRFFQHRDGSLARFNGMGATVQDRVLAVLRYDATNATPLNHAPHSGYERLAQGETVIIADTGAPPKAVLSNAANAGCLSFEMSCAGHSFIVNCGIDTYGPIQERSLGRATAAHSTITINDTSQGRFEHAARWRPLLGSPLLDGPQEVLCERNDTESTQSFRASHDGYADKFGLMHERTITLSHDGRLLQGVDRVKRIERSSKLPSETDSFAVRFHLHPDITASVEEVYLVLSARDGARWRFGSLDVAPSLEESVYFAGIAGPKRTRQIVLSGSISATPQIRWRLERIKSLV